MVYSTLGTQSQSQTVSSGAGDDGRNTVQSETIEWVAWWNHVQFHHTTNSCACQLTATLDENPYDHCRTMLWNIQYKPYGEWLKDFSHLNTSHCWHEWEQNQPSINPDSMGLRNQMLIAWFRLLLDPCPVEPKWLVIQWSYGQKSSRALQVY